MFQDIKARITEPKISRIISLAMFDSSPESVAKDAARYQASDRLNVYGWIENGEIIGICGFEVHPDKVEIHRMAVATDRQWQGVGGRMIRTLQNMFALPLEAETDDDAVGFYRNCGFEASAFLHPTWNMTRYTCVLTCQPKRNSMRRADRKVTDFAEIVDIISRADTVRLGIKGDPYPYVVPLSYGFEVHDGKIRLYFHGAKEGFKHDLLAHDNRVCAEFDIFHRYAPTERSFTTEYESVIGFGRAVPVDGPDSTKGLDLILAHCGFAGFGYDPAATKVTQVWKIELYEVKGKKLFVP